MNTTKTTVSILLVLAAAAPAQVNKSNLNGVFAIQQGGAVAGATVRLVNQDNFCGAKGNHRRSRAVPVSS